MLRGTKQIRAPTLSPGGKGGCVLKFLRGLCTKCPPRGRGPNERGFRKAPQPRPAPWPRPELRRLNEPGGEEGNVSEDGLQPEAAGGRQGQPVLQPEVPRARQGAGEHGREKANHGHPRREAARSPLSCQQCTPVPAEGVGGAGRRGGKARLRREGAPSLAGRPPPPAPAL